MRESMMPVYNPPELVFSYGEGVRLFTTAQVPYLDFTAGIGVNSLGYRNQHVANALKDQIDQLWHLSNMFRIPSAEKLAERITNKTFADYVFFGNSGAEANECGLKILRRYHYDKGRPEKNRIIAMNHSFHGRTISTVAAAGNPNYTKGFVVNDQGFDHVDLNDFEQLEKMVSEKTAGIILEPIQGEGGITVVDINYLQKVRQLCDDQDILLMFDEVQCGVGRSGKLYAYEKLAVCPDVLSSAKGIGAGFPLGMCLATRKAAACMLPGTHGSTFGGNPLATVVGNAVLDQLEQDGFLEHVENMGNYLAAELEKLVKKYPNVYTHVSGMGLMIGLGVVPENTQFVSILREKYHILIVKAGGNSLRFLPPLIVEKEDIDLLIDALYNITDHFND